MHNAIPRRDVLKIAAGLSLAAAGSLAARPSIATPADVPDVMHGRRDRSQVALTFHGAGDDKLAKAILRELEQAQVSVTVMAVGTWLQASPQVAKAYASAGHVIGNHTMHHYPMKKLSASQALQEITSCAALLNKILGVKLGLFRPSGTQHSTATIRSAARRAGYTGCISYDVDSRDYQDIPAPQIVTNVSSKVQPGSIVSLHLGHANTLPALAGIISALEKQKLQPVTLNTLLGA